jgi:hypothetical protein
LEAINKIADYVGYAGYEEVIGSAINLNLYPYGWQTTDPTITITTAIEREYETSIDDGFGNHIFVKGTPQAAYPSRDFYCEGGVAKGYWAALNGECALADDTVEHVVNDKSVKITKSAGSQTEIGATLTFPLCVDINEKKLKKLCLALKTSYGTEFMRIILQDNWSPVRRISWLTTVSLANRKYENGWAYFDLPLAIYRTNQFSNWHVREVDEYPHKDTWGVDYGSEGGFNWKLLKLTIKAVVPAAQALTWNIDGLHFEGSVPADPIEDTSLPAVDQPSIDAYGRTVMWYDAPEVGFYDVVHLLGDSILQATKNPLIKLKAKQGAKTWAKPNQYVSVNMPVYGINADYRIVEIDHDWKSNNKLLRSTLSLTPRYQPVTSREWFAGLIEGIMNEITW